MGEAREGLREDLETLLKCTDSAWEKDALARLEQRLWECMDAAQGTVFQTCKGLCFTYRMKGNEIFVDRKQKSIPRSSVRIALRQVILLQRSGQAVSGPKKLKVFGASYLYPIFMKCGVIAKQADMS